MGRGSCVDEHFVVSDKTQFQVIAWRGVMDITRRMDLTRCQFESIHCTLCYANILPASEGSGSRVYIQFSLLSLLTSILSLVNLY